MQASFRNVLQEQALTPLYQPIVDLRSGDIIGYEGLIRGPSDSPLHAPSKLFNVARQCGKTAELETLCRRVHIERFLALGLTGKLFLNVSPDSLLLSAQGSHASVLTPLPGDMRTEDLVFELTESEATSSYESLRQVASDYRGFGLQIAIDDLGEGFSSLRLWSELRPEYVKIDKYFIQDISHDVVKQQFVRSIFEIAQQSKSMVIAEGIETERELAAVRSLGIPYGQGYFLARPSDKPKASLPSRVLALFNPAPHPRRALMNEAYKSVATAKRLLRQAPAFDHAAPASDLMDAFQRQPELQAVAVLRDGLPLGLIQRLRLQDRLDAMPADTACRHFVEHAPLVVDQHSSVHDIGRLFTESNPHHLADGFVITDKGRYLGIGTGFDLIREITQMQIHAARYANPLTQLPGNVPINQHIQTLLSEREPFAVCSCDLDHFKPFNERYSYQKGDEAIQILADLLRECTDPNADFVGHAGGDDFMVVFKSANWLSRCRDILDQFPARTAHLYVPAHLSAAGFLTESRQGDPVFHRLLSVSLGVVQVLDPALPYSSHQIAEAAAAARGQAKKQVGNTLFVERRMMLAHPASPGGQPGRERSSR